MGDGDDTLAAVEPIKQSLPWSARAAAGDCLQRVDHGDHLVCMWIKPGGGVTWSKSNTTVADIACMAALLTQWAGRALDGGVDVKAQN